MTTPKCTISLDWRGPACGKDAISMNDHGGFQCQFHDSLPRYKGNPIGPFIPIDKDDVDSVQKLQEAYDNYLQRRKFNE